MTIRFLTGWNGFYEGQIATTLTLANEAALISAGIATADLDGGNNVDDGPRSALYSSGVPTFVQSSGTIGNNGAISGLTALPLTFPDVYLYFPAGALYAGSLAGSYYAIMSSTTAGTVYDNMYTGGPVSIPGAPKPIVATGPGAYVQTINTDITLIMFPNLGLALGNHGQLVMNENFAYNILAGNKIFKRLVNASSLGSSVRATTGGHDSFSSRLRAVGKQTRQAYYAASEAATSSGAAHIIASHNLAEPATISFTCNIDTATNWAGFISVNGRIER